MKNRTISRSVAFCSAVLFGAVSAQAVEWNNALGDNVMTNAGNWASTPDGEFVEINLSGADRALLTNGMSLTVKDVRVGINSLPDLTGEIEIAGGFLRSDRSGGDTRLGYTGRTGIVNMSGGEWEVAQDLAVGLGGAGIFNLSGGEVDNQRGTFEVSGADSIMKITGGIFKTRFGATLKNEGTFRVEGTNATLIGIGASSTGDGTWVQNSGATFSVGISTGGVAVTEISGATGTATFQFGSLLDVDFLDGYEETNTWTIMTSEGAMTDNGLQFSTNVNTDVWSFAVTNNELQVTYGVGSEPPPTNTPPTGPRTLYWANSSGSQDMTIATNWLEFTGSSYEQATWGLFEGDSLYIGHNGSYAPEGPIYEATYAGQTAEKQSELYIGVSRSGTLNFDSGSLDFDTQNRQVKIGMGTRGHGILNMNGGSLEGEAFRVGMDRAGNDGIINLAGGSLTAARAVRLGGIDYSLSVGENGSYGEVNVSGGSLNFRFGAILGNNGGTAKFHVNGSDASLIGLGTKNSGSPGKWIQNTESTLSVVIDEGGLTPITVKGWGVDKPAQVTFETNSVIEVDWAAGVTNYGIFDVMTWEGEFIDNGLTLSTNVNTNIWSFAFDDTNADGTNDILRVIADPGTTGNGTPLLWLYSYGLDEADDTVDNDSDGLLTWEEYIAGTDPTDENSVLKVTSLSSEGSDYVITWQSIAGKSYSIITNASLVIPNPGTAASGIIGEDGETSVTSSIPSAPTVFIEIGVE